MGFSSRFCNTVEEKKFAVSKMSTMISSVLQGVITKLNIGT